MRAAVSDVVSSERAVKVLVSVVAIVDDVDCSVPVRDSEVVADLRVSVDDSVVKVGSDDVLGRVPVCCIVAVDKIV